MYDRRPITTEDIHNHLEEKIFRLQPSDYCKKYPKWPGSVGIEVESFTIFRNANRKLVTVIGEKGLDALLRKLALERGWSFEEQTLTGLPQLMLVKLDKDDFFTFEPGGQLEFSSRPYPCLSDAVQRLREIQGTIDETFSIFSHNNIQMGINPWHSVEEIGLQVAKPRYEAMDTYFQSISEFGQRMMRQTCTIQVNLDFGNDEQTLATRFAAANLIAPFATALFAYSPVCEGKFTNYKSFRGKIWHGVDPSRTGFVSLKDILRSPNKQSCIASYKQLVMDSKVIFFSRQNNKIPKNLNFYQWLHSGYEGDFPHMEDFETQLSLLFPEVRARGFMELRSIDSQSRCWQDAPAAFYTGLLYDNQTLQACIDYLAPLHDNLDELWRLAPHGLDHERIAKGAKRLMQMACEGFQRLPACFRDEKTVKSLYAFDQLMTQRDLTPADALLQELQRQGEMSEEMITRLEHQWQESLAVY